MTTVLKLGGELLEDQDAVQAAARATARLASGGRLVVVHGGGRAIDAELRARGETPRFVDGLRITDAAALDAVVAVLAGRTNTSFVAALGTMGTRAVGLTGADGGIGLCSRVAPFESVSGDVVDLGLVGEPADPDARLLDDLLTLGCLPVVASLGITREGALLNVNADVLAAHLAVALGAHRLIVAGGTAGVLDANSRTLPSVSVDDVDAMAASGAAHSGMVAKLNACRYALTRGVSEVFIVSGRHAADYASAPGTRIVPRTNGNTSIGTNGAPVTEPAANSAPRREMTA